MEPLNQTCQRRSLLDPARGGTKVVQTCRALRASILVHDNPRAPGRSGGDRGFLDPSALAEHLQPSLAMSDALPVVYLARHGETAWTISGQHTGATDLPLTAQGEAEAVRLAEPLAGLTFAAVFTSPLQRAVQTCELAGFGPVAEVEPDLVEWNYGTYEGRTSAEIRAERPGWQVFRDGCPGGESPEQVGSRADRVIRRVRAIGGDVLLFSSGHFLRMFAARWLDLEPGAGRYFLLGTASLSALGYEHDRSEPVIRLWDERPHDRRVTKGQVSGTGR
jgi:broad specificity phosphatase PhoE